MSGFGIHVVEVAGKRLVKRLQRKVDGSVPLISDNPSYQADLVSPQMARWLNVVGRVVWVGGAFEGLTETSCAIVEFDGARTTLLRSIDAA